MKASLSSIPNWANTRISSILEKKSAGSGNKVPASNPMGYTIGQMLIGNANKAVEDLVSLDGSRIDQKEASGVVDASHNGNQLQGSFPEEIAEDVIGALNNPEQDIEAASYRKNGDQETAVYLHKEDQIFTIVQLERISETETGAIFMEMGPKDTDGFVQTSS